MTWEVVTGHSLDGLGQVEPQSVQTCVTSPPYWGLRDYADSGQAWPAVSFAPISGLPPIDIPAQTVALGLEPDPSAYVGHLVEVFRAVRRVLRDDGTLWLNLGDSYAGGGGGNYGEGLSVSAHKTHPTGGQDKPRTPPGLKTKDLCGIPWRVAFALQADGWYLRSDIIWHKPNPMPESVTDRPTKAHEYVFLFAHPDSGGKYYYGQDAIREAPAKASYDSRTTTQERKEDGHPTRYGNTSSGSAKGFGMPSIPPPTGGRNARSVWTITTRPYSAAHFATFPPDLPERCIKAGSRPGDLVLDPFSGAGTTGLVARRLQRSYLGVEQSETYATMSRKRIESDAPLFNWSAP